MKNERTIVIFPVKEKKTPSHPDFTGKIQEGDTVINEVVLWWNESKTGNKYLKGKINEPKPATTETK
jgi:uncharacterized protein (DUF736 family)